MWKPRVGSLNLSGRPTENAYRRALLEREEKSEGDAADAEGGAGAEKFRGSVLLPPPSCPSEFWPPKQPAMGSRSTRRIGEPPRHRIVAPTVSL